MSKPVPPRITTYKEFWPFYLREHSRIWTKRLHVLGTTLGIFVAIGLGLNGHATYMPVALVIGYGFAWYSHFFIEHNRPATFRYPLWSFVSDFRMLYWYYRGKFRY